MKPAEPIPEVPRGVVRFYNFLVQGNPFLEDALAGLSQLQKRISPRYFYDERGSQRFAAVCEQPECYLLRSEIAILRDNLAAIVQFIGPEAELIELRAGVGVQTALLIEQLRPLVYVPIDIDGRMLEATSGELAELYPWLNISGMRADFSRRLALPEFVGLPIRKKVIFLPGSVIGGFTPDEALEVLHNARQLTGTGDVLLAGVDLKKDEKTIESAYCDANGMNAELHLNLLARINRELDGNFQPARFAYHAFHDRTKGCVTMYLVSRYSQFAHVGGRRFDFAANETIDTGVAYQYSEAEFQELARQAGFVSQTVWTDAERMFSIHGMTAV
jgi:dimethylhistidine N-methyltransferase